MIVLIDCGATHNFIYVKLVEDLKLEVTPTNPYSIEVGDGHKFKHQGLRKSLPIELQELRFELGGVDLVSGVEWLARLGAVEANFDKLTLTVKVQDR